MTSPTQNNAHGGADTAATTATAAVADSAAAHRPAPSLLTDAERRAIMPKPLIGLDIERLVQLKALMAEEGQTVHLARMLSDRLYAYERIACAHASAHEPLRDLALGLFQTCRRSDEARHSLL